MARDDYEGLERRMLQWLDDNPPKERFGVGVHQPRPHEMKSPAAAGMNSPRMLQVERNWKSSQRPTKRNQINWASCGPGMQAVFLGSGPRSCGTGVFIPRTEGTNLQFNNKPAFSPVLLPARVVQTLNLNVHELGQQVKPPSEHRKNIMKKNNEKMEKKKKKDDDVICISPDIFLPKEWTY